MAEDTAAGAPLWQPSARLISLQEEGRAWVSVTRVSAAQGPVDTITIKADDLGQLGAGTAMAASVTLSVRLLPSPSEPAFVLSPDVISAGGLLYTDEDMAVFMGGSLSLAVTSSDAAAYRLAMSSGHAGFSLADGLAGDDVRVVGGSQSVESIEAQLPRLQQLLQQAVVVTPAADFNGVATLSFVLSRGPAVITTSSLPLVVRPMPDAMAIDVPSEAIVAMAGQPANIPAVAIRSVDGPDARADVSIACANNGSVALELLSGDSGFLPSLLVSCDASCLDTLLQGLQYRCDAGDCLLQGRDVITITVTPMDAPSASADVRVEVVPSLAPPTISGLPEQRLLVTDEDSAGVALPQLQVQLNTAGSQGLAPKVQLEMTVRHGRLSAASTAGFEQNLAIADAAWPRGGGYLLSFKGAVEEANRFLASQQLYYSSPADFNGFDAVTISVVDVTRAWPADSPRSVAVELPVYVQAVNDAPEILLLSSELAALQCYLNATEEEDGGGNQAGGVGLGGLFGISDVDADDPAGTGIMSLTLTAAKGSIAKSPLSSAAALPALWDDALDGGQSVPTLTLHGSASALTATLAGLRYMPPPEFVGQDQLNLMLDDNGNWGSGGAKTASVSLPVDVVAVANMQPTWRVGEEAGWGPTQTVPAREDSPLGLGFLSVIDPDDEVLTVQLSAMHGNMTVLRGEKKNLWFIDRGGRSGGFAVKGRVADINRALQVGRAGTHRS